MSDPVADKAPFDAEGDGRGVLVLHGITGTPFEVKPVAEALARAGCTVRTPLLDGHGRTLADLARTTWPDWLGSADAALEALLARVGGPVSIVGFSMGGLLALRLARLRPRDVSALVVMSAPLRLRRYQVTGVRLLSHLPRAWRAMGRVPKWTGADTSDEEMKRRNPGLPAFPLTAVENLLDLMDVVRADLPSVKHPTLVVHGKQDHTVPMDDALELVGSLGADVVERLWLERSYHLVAIDVERGDLAEAILRFLAQHAWNQQPRARKAQGRALV